MPGHSTLSHIFCVNQLTKQSILVFPRQFIVFPFPSRSGQQLSERLINRGNAQNANISKPFYIIIVRRTHLIHSVHFTEFDNQSLHKLVHRLDRHLFFFVESTHCHQPVLDHLAVDLAPFIENKRIEFILKMFFTEKRRGQQQIVVLFRIILSDIPEKD